jgi:hypothetical protein
MKNLATILFFTVIIITLLSCDKDNEESNNFYDTEYRIGLWITNDKRDTLEFVNESKLVRKGDFYSHEEYTYKIVNKTLFVKLPNTSNETQHVISLIEKNIVTLGNMYLTTGFADNSGTFIKEEN